MNVGNRPNFENVLSLHAFLLRLDWSMECPNSKIGGYRTVTMSRNIACIGKVGFLNGPLAIHSLVRI